MAFINPKFKQHVASICGHLDGDEHPAPKGTGFFVRVTNSLGLMFDYLVTAKHVIEGIDNVGARAYLRVNKGGIGEHNQGTLDMPLSTRDGWLFHPDSSVDLAVLPNYQPLPGQPPKQKTPPYRFLYLAWESVARGRTSAPMWPPGEAEQVMFIAITTQFQGVGGLLPTVRMGHVSLVTDELIKGHYGMSNYHVVEAQVYPGNSGAPVWVEMMDRETKESGWYMLGLVAFSYPALEELRRVRGATDEAYYNLGLSLVVPIEKLADILDSEEEIARRETAEGSHLPGTAISNSGDDESFEMTPGSL